MPNKPDDKSLAASVLLSEGATGPEREGPYTYWAAQPDAIPSSGFVSASSGDRTDSRTLITQFVNEYRTSGRVSGEVFEYVASIMEKVLEADTHHESNRRGDEFMKALNLGGKLDRHRRRVAIIQFVDSICQNPKQRNDVLYRDLVEWGMVQDDMPRCDFSKMISEILAKQKQ